MTKPRTVSINIPFDGFYDSKWSQELDHTEERDAEYWEERQGEEGVAPELRLTAAEYAQFRFDHTSYGQAHETLARDYAAAFSRLIGEEIGIKLRLEFEEMTSPREYNFATDRIFCRVPVSVVRALFAHSKREKHATLAAVIRRRFTSRDGFSSYYRNDLESWLAKRATDWDHNELATLLIAVMESKGLERESGSGWDWDIFESFSGNGVFDSAIDSACDWEKVEAAILERREEIAQEMRESMGITMPIDATWTRCPHTLDLFKERGVEVMASGTKANPFRYAYKIGKGESEEHKGTLDCDSLLNCAAVVQSEIDSGQYGVGAWLRSVEQIGEGD